MLDPNRPFQPGRYAAIDIGSMSVLLLVADLDAEGRLTPLVEAERVTRLGEQALQTGVLDREARNRTGEAVALFHRLARDRGAEQVAAVGTAALREAKNGPDFAAQMARREELRLEVVSGEREAELAYAGNLLDRRLPAADGERVVVDIGGGSTEIVRGLGYDVLGRVSIPIGALNLTDRFLREDPPHVTEIRAAMAEINSAVERLRPVRPGTLLLGSGGTFYHAAQVAQQGGLIPGDRPHGSVLTTRALIELIELFQTLPLQFRRRVPGLDPERADVILAGLLIAQKVLTRLVASSIIVTANGVRHGYLYELSQRAASVR